jgi:type II secretory pathway component PulF
MSVRLNANEKLNLVSNLGTLLGAGIPLLEAIESLSAGTKGRTQLIVARLKKDVEQGTTVADSLSRFPDAFDAVTVNLIRAAEDAGTLVAALKNISVGIKKDMEFTDKVKAALLYPVLVMGLFAVVLVIILTFVIPRIVTVFGRLRVVLPLPTRALIAVSSFLLAHYVLIAVTAAALAALVVFLYVSKRRLLIGWLSALPFVSRLAIHIDLARCMRALNLLLSSGIPITNALMLAQTVVAKRAVGALIGRVHRMVSAGQRVAGGFADHPDIISPLAVKILAAGEESGTLELSALELAEYFDAEVSKSLRTLTTLLEPIMLVLVGVFVGAIMLAIIVPIYGLISQLKAR